MMPCADISPPAAASAAASSDAVAVEMMMTTMNTATKSTALIDFIFSNVNIDRNDAQDDDDGVIEFDIIFSAFDALVRVEISPHVAFDQFECDVMKSLYKQQTLFTRTSIRRHAFLNHVDSVLKFIFWHNVYKFHNNDDNNNEPSDAQRKAYRAVSTNLRALILNAPDRLNILINAQYSDRVIALNDLTTGDNDDAIVVNNNNVDHINNNNSSDTDNNTSEIGRASCRERVSSPV